MRDYIRRVLFSPQNRFKAPRQNLGAFCSLRRIDRFKAPRQNLGAFLFSPLPIMV